MFTQSRPSFLLGRGGGGGWGLGSLISPFTPEGTPRLRATTSDSFNYTNCYDVKTAGRLCVLGAIAPIQLNSHIQSTLTDEDVGLGFRV